MAGPHVRGACKRHLDDLANASNRGLKWDIEAANRALAYFPDVLTVLAGGQVVAFALADWQSFVVGSLFGWRSATTGLRRFRTAFVETAKGSGKSPLAAGIGHYMFLADKEARAEIYAAATKKDQAMILFKDAVDMVDASEELRSRVLKSGVNPVYKLSHLKSGSIFKPISNDDGQSGPRPSCALVDEIHEHKDRTTISMLEAGFKFRKQPLLFLITNSGSDRHSVCFEYHEHAVKVCAGEREDDSFFAYVCALDEGEDPLENEACWEKANPSLGVTIDREYLRRQVANAKALPGNQNTVLRLNFCVWTEAESAWMKAETWRKCEFPREVPADPEAAALLEATLGPDPDADLRLEDFAGADCYSAVDLSFTRDLTAAAHVFPDGGLLYLFVDFWTPGDTLAMREEEDRVPYGKWVEAKFLNAPAGKVVKLEAVAARLGWIDRTFNLKGIAYDAYREKELADDLTDLGLESVAEKLKEHPQGFRRANLFDSRGRPVRDGDGNIVGNPLWMPSSVAALEEAILEQKLRALVNPVLRWNVGAAVVRDDPAGTGNKVFTKLKAHGRIDGLVASAMAVGLAKARKVEPKSLDGFLSNPVMIK